MSNFSLSDFGCYTLKTSVFVATDQASWPGIMFFYLCLVYFILDFFFFTFCLILTWLCAWWKNPWIWMSSLFFNYFFTCQNLDSTICFVTLPLSGILSSMHYFSHRVPFLNLFVQDYTFRNHFYSSLNFSFFFHTQQHIWHSIN